MPSKHAHGCELVRVPGFQDLHSDHGIRFAKAKVNTGIKLLFAHVWLAFPHLHPDLEYNESDERVCYEGKLHRRSRGYCNHQYEFSKKTIFRYFFVFFMVW